MSVVPYARPAEPSSRQWVELMQPAIELAKAVSGTDFVPKAMRDNPAAITAAILYGDEVGLGPMQSLAKISVIDGKPSLAAEAQRALILSHGHDLWIEDSTITRCTIAGRRKDSDLTSRVTWTLDDAKRANLAGKQNWRNYPRQMLLARASAELARAIFADAIGGLAATEELEDTDQAADQSSAATDGSDPAPPTSRRRRRTTPAATVSAPPPPSEPLAPSLPPLPGDEPPAPERASDAQRRKLHAMFRERGINDRDERLDYCNQIIHRTIFGSKELTVAEASEIIDALERTPVPEQAPPDAPEQAPPDETHSAATPSLLSGESDPARPDAASTQGASGPEAPAGGQQPIGEQLVSPQLVEILQWMRREAGVDDAWVRTHLLELGVSASEPITSTTLRALTHTQARRLQGELNTILDSQDPEAGR